MLVLSVLFISMSTYAQENTEPFFKQNALKISPVEFGKAEFQLTYERYFNDRSSSLSIMPSIILEDSFNESQEGYQLMAQYRFFLTHLRKDQGKSVFGFHNIGFYAGVYGLALDYQKDYMAGYWDDFTMDYIENEYTHDQTSYEGGAIIGLQIDISNRILLDMYIGGGIRKTDATDTIDDDPNIDMYYRDYNVFDREYNGVKPRLGLQLGILF